MPGLESVLERAQLLMRLGRLTGSEELGYDPFGGVASGLNVPVVDWDHPLLLTRNYKMGIWAKIQEVGNFVSSTRLKALLEEPNLSAAGDALDFLSEALTEAPTKTPQQELRIQMAKWTAERLRASILMLVVNSAPNAAVLAERALGGVETQLVFKAKPDVEKRFLSGVRVDSGDRKEASYTLDDLRWLHNTIWPKPPRRGQLTTSDKALSVEGDEPAEDAKVIRALAKLTREQMDLIENMFSRPETKTRFHQVRSQFKFGILDDVLNDVRDRFPLPPEFRIDQ